MVDIRAARTEELDIMLAVMCEAFGLPYSPARELFYKDPYFDISRKRVLLLDGLLVSCLTIVEADLWIGEALVRVGGIAGVATRQTHRRQGHGSRLLVGTLPFLREQGCVLSGLYPFEYEFYRRLGWERTGTQFRLVTVPGHLPRYAEARYVRQAAPADRADIARLYDATSRGRTGRWLRAPRRWDYLRMHIKHTVVFKHGSVGVEGYALFDTRESRDCPRHLRVLEMAAETEEAWRGLAGYLAEADANELSYTGDWDDLADSGLLDGSRADNPATALPRVEMVPGPMFRVVDFAGCLGALRPNFVGALPAGREVCLAMTDPLAPPNLPTAALLTGGAGVSVTPLERGRLPRHRIEGDAQAWAQVLTGHHSLRDALSLNRIRATADGPVDLAAPLFPRRNLFIPASDHF